MSFEMCSGLTEMSMKRSFWQRKQHGERIVAPVLGYAFFGTSFTSVQAIEEAVKQKGARFVCLDLGRLSGMDCTFADQIRLLVLSLERDSAAVKRFFSFDFFHVLPGR